MRNKTEFENINRLYLIRFRLIAFVNSVHDILLHQVLFIQMSIKQPVHLQFRRLNST
jgi:hypothetical protein